MAQVFGLDGHERELGMGFEVIPSKVFGGIPSVQRRDEELLSIEKKRGKPSRNSCKPRRLSLVSSRNPHVPHPFACLSKTRWILFCTCWNPTTQSRWPMNTYLLSSFIGLLIKTVVWSRISLIMGFCFPLLTWIIWMLFCFVYRFVVYRKSNVIWMCIRFVDGISYVDVNWYAMFNLSRGLLKSNQNIQKREKETNL